MSFKSVCVGQPPKGTGSCLCGWNRTSSNCRTRIGDGRAPSQPSPAGADPLLRSGMGRQAQGGLGLSPMLGFQQPGPPGPPPTLPIYCGRTLNSTEGLSLSSGYGGCLHGQRGSRTSQGRGTAQDGRGPGLQHHGWQRTELPHLYLPGHPRGCGRPPWGPQAWRPAAVGERRGECGQVLALCAMSTALTEQGPGDHPDLGL